MQGRAAQLAMRPCAHVPHVRENDAPRAIVAQKRLHTGSMPFDFVKLANAKPYSKEMFDVRCPRLLFKGKGPGSSQVHSRRMKKSRVD
jgi:hypothetical protein